MKARPPPTHRLPWHNPWYHITTLHSCNVSQHTKHAEAAKKFLGKLMFVIIDTSREENANVVQFFGIKPEEHAAVRIVNLDEDMKVCNVALRSALVEYLNCSGIVSRCCFISFWLDNVLPEKRN